MTDSARPTDADLGLRRHLAILGAVNIRLLIPLWIIAGATVKMTEAAPSFLPMNSILRPARALDLDLQFVLAVLVAIEFAMAAAMILIPRLARPLAIMIMSVFCGVLINEMIRGASSCGCFGSKSPPPGAMLAIDAVMLLAALLLRPARERLLPEPARWIGAVVLSFVMVVVSWRMIDPGGEVVTLPPPPPPLNPDGGGDGGTGTGGPETGDNPGETTSQGAGEVEAAGTQTPAPAPVAVAGPRRNPNPTPLPQFWFSEDLEQYVGRPWTDFPLFRYMEIWPTVPERGLRFITFYSRTCEHCEDLFNDLLVQPRYARNTTAIEVPYGKREMRPADAAWPLPGTLGLEMMALPLGPDWILTTPLDMRIEDGLIVELTEAGVRPGEDEPAEPLPHGPVWDVNPSRLELAPANAGATALPPAAAPEPAPAAATPSAPPAPALVSRTNPSPAALPQWWFSEDLPSWEGRDWREFPLFTFMPEYPTVPTVGTRYVVFYRRDCDHCREMYENDFMGNDALSRQTTAIEVPYDKQRMTPPDAWAIPRTAVEAMQMPLGPDYIITTPLAIRIEDGRIVCIEEGDHVTCFELDNAG